MRNSSVCVFRDTCANYILWTICAHVCELSGINRDIENPIIMIQVSDCPNANQERIILCLGKQRPGAGLGCFFFFFFFFF